MERKEVLRFSAIIRLAHWMHTITFFILVATGLLLYSNFFDWLAPLFGGFSGARIVHRVAAVFFILPTVLVLLISPKELFHWLKEITSWDKNDTAFVASFPKKFFGVDSTPPPQGFYNGGEKVNSILIIILTILLTVTGIIMWFADNFTLGLVRLAYPIHSISMAISLAVVIGHAYLSLLNPTSNEAIRGMIKGKVSEEYMQEHHAQWYEEVKQGGK